LNTKPATKFIPKFKEKHPFILRGLAVFFALMGMEFRRETAAMCYFVGLFTSMRNKDI
jgi:hypothetical protein